MTRVFDPRSLGATTGRGGIRWWGAAVRQALARVKAKAEAAAEAAKSGKAPAQEAAPPLPGPRPSGVCVMPAFWEADSMVWRCRWVSSGGMSVNGRADERSSALVVNSGRSTARAAHVERGGGARSRARRACAHIGGRWRRARARVGQGGCAGERDRARARALAGGRAGGALPPARAPTAREENSAPAKCV